MRACRPAPSAPWLRSRLRSTVRSAFVRPLKEDVTEKERRVHVERGQWLIAARRRSRRGRKSRARGDSELMIARAGVQTAIASHRAAAALHRSRRLRGASRSRSRCSARSHAAAVGFRVHRVASCDRSRDVTIVDGIPDDEHRSDACATSGAVADDDLVEQALDDALRQWLQPAVDRARRSNGLDRPGPQRHGGAAASARPARPARTDCPTAVRAPDRASDRRASFRDPVRQHPVHDERGRPDRVASTSPGRTSSSASRRRARWHVGTAGPRREIETGAISDMIELLDTEWRDRSIRSLGMTR